MIAEEDMVIAITRSGYIKRLPVSAYREQRRGGIGVMGMDLKEEDYIQHLFVASTHDYILFFTSVGKVYRLKVHELPLGSRQAKGRAIVNLLPFRQDEQVRAVIATRNFEEAKYLLFATRKGVVKKTEFAEYNTPLKADGIIAIKLREDDELVGVRHSNGDDDVLMVSRGGQAIRFHEQDVRPMGRPASGVQGMRLRGDDEVIEVDIARDDAELLVVTKNGWGKRTRVSEYPVKGRGGLGVQTAKLVERKGKLAGAYVVREGIQVMLISDGGTVIRIPVDGIKRSGRATQGVIVMRLREGEQVSSLALTTATEADEANGDDAPTCRFPICRFRTSPPTRRTSSARALSPGVLAAALAEERPDQVDGRWEDDRGRVRRSDLEQRLQVAELQRHRRGGHHLGCVLQPLRGLELALGGDHLRAPFALGLGLARHCPLHARRDLDVLDLDDRDLDAPGGRGLVDDGLEDRVDLVALREELVQHVLPEHRAQGRLGDLRRRRHEVLDLDDCRLRLDDAEVGDGVDAHRDVVLGDHFLRRHVERDRPQVDLDHPVDDRDQQEETRPLRFGQQAAEPEDDAALVLARDLDRGEEEEDDDQGDGGDGDQGWVHCGPLSVGLVDPTTTSPRPSSMDSTRTRSPGVSWWPSAERARQSSPATST